MNFLNSFGSLINIVNFAAASVFHFLTIFAKLSRFTFSLKYLMPGTSQTLRLHSQKKSQRTALVCQNQLKNLSDHYLVNRNHFFKESKFHHFSHLKFMLKLKLLRFAQFLYHPLWVHFDYLNSNLQATPILRFTTLLE